MNRSSTTRTLSVFLSIMLCLISFMGSAAPAAAQVFPGHVRAFGLNDNGQLGNGGTISTFSPVQVKNISGVVAAAGGADHSIALDSNGNVWAWGANQSGQLGNGSNTSSYTPLPVSIISGVVAISAGGNHSAALDAGGNVWGWGANLSGQLGNGANIDSNIPVPVSAISGIVAISAGNSHTLAVDSSGRLWAWGSNVYGQLGNGTNIDSAVPVQVSSLTGIVAIAAGASHSVAVDSSGRVWTWGRNSNWQLGTGNTTDSNVPVIPGSLTGVISIAAGYIETLALDASGNVWRWGGHLLSEDGVPVKKNDLPAVAAVAAGSYYNLALDQNGNVWSWETNIHGALGLGPLTPFTETPMKVNDLAGVAAIAAGDNHTLAIGPAPQETCDTTIVTQLTVTSTYVGSGEAVYQTAAVANRGTCSSLPYGSVQYEYSRDGGTTWSAFGDVKPLDTGGNTVSGRYPLFFAGAVHFRANYSGDALHDWSRSTPDMLMVSKAPTAVSGHLSAAIVPVNSPVTYMITISASTRRPAGGKWIAQVSRDPTFSTGVVTLGGGTVSGSLPVTVSTKPFSPAYPGTLYLRAIYTGDSNFTGSSSADTLTVAQ